MKKGISLIILVITIIITIIIAATVIITISDSDIITKASAAVNAQNVSAVKDQLMIALSNIKLHISKDPTHKYNYYENKNAFVTYGGLDLKNMDIETYIVNSDNKDEISIALKYGGKPYIFKLNVDIGTVTAINSINTTEKSIAYVLNGGTNGENAISKYTEGEVVNLPIPTKSGAIFIGWYSNSEYTGDKLTSTTIDTKGNLTLYAKWGVPSDDSYFNYTLSGTNATITGLSTAGISAYDSGNLSEIVVPSTYTSNDVTYSVTTINASAFSGKTNIYGIVIPKEITNIGVNAFYNCGKTADELKITLEPGRTSLSSTFLQGANYLKKIVIPEGVTAIQGSYNQYESSKCYGAFKNCTSLVDITFPDTVTQLAVNSFYGCISLHKIALPSSVVTLGDYSFYGCAALTNITLSSNLASIGKCAFSSCTGLASITFPSSLTSIGIDAFKNDILLDNININKNITSIGVNAFNNCGKTNGEFKVTIESGRTSLPQSFLQGANYLKKIIVPEGVTIINGAHNIYDSGSCYGAFRYCTLLSDVTLPSTLTQLGIDAFFGCTELITITIPPNVTTIGSYAFYGCSSLTNITLSSSLTTIGTSSFNGCSRLASIAFPSTLNEIGPTAFKNDVLLNNIKLTKNINSIGANAFNNCGKTNGEFKVTIESGRASLPQAFLLGANYLKEIVIPEGVTVINGSHNEYNPDVCYGAFKNCIALTEIVFPNTIRNIGVDMFAGCTALTNITIPASITSIGAYSFYGCTGLTNITIPSSVTTIGNGAFSSCTKLNNVALSENLTFIGASSFKGCIALNKISIPIKLNDMGANSFQDCGKTAGKFEVTIESGRTSLPRAFMQGANYLKEISIPEGITVINGSHNAYDLTTTYGAFRSCTALTQVTFPSTLTSIGPDVFRDCTGLTNITLPSGITNIGAYSLYNCTNLSTINYNNTTEIWAAVTKGANWSTGIVVTGITCTNGTANL